MNEKEVTYEFTAGQIDIIEEHFHPAGSVRYMIIRDAEFKLNPGALFTITQKEELRQV